MKKTVLELDLVGYSSICSNLEEGLDVKTLSRLNAQIQGFIDAGLAVVKAKREQNVIQTTGDGAILVFDSAADAHAFAVAVHGATSAHNSSRTQPLAKRVFRIGVATGEIDMEPTSGGGFEVAGSTVARAVRLEAKAPPGGLLVDKETFHELPRKQRTTYGPEQIVAGKRDEVFAAYSWPPDEKATATAEYFSSLGRNTPPSPVLKIWQEKLQFLQYEEALASNPTLRFELKKQIEEAKAKISEYGE